MRRRHHLSDSLLRGKPQHMYTLSHIRRAVIQPREDVAVNVNYSSQFVKSLLRIISLEFQNIKPYNLIGTCNRKASVYKHRIDQLFLSICRVFC